MSESQTAKIIEAVPGIDRQDASVCTMLCTLMRSLAEDEDAIEVIGAPSPESVAFHVHCSPDDVPRLIGNRGHTARAVRAILKAIASKNGRKYTLIIAE